jgi:hypothetical protein
MTEKGSPEKRKLPRLEGITFPVEYTVKEEPATPMRGRALSVGESGLMIATENPLPVGTVLPLKLYLPRTLFPFSNWQTVTAEAKIIWADNKPDSDGFHCYGVLIQKISDQDAATLKDCINLSRWLNEKTGNR